MKPARAFLQVVLSVFLVAAMVVSSGFAATKKLDRHRNPSRDWNDLSLQNGDLLDVGSSVPGGVGSLRLSQAGDPGGILTLPPSSPDNWNGGTGNWSNAGQWSAGEPGASSDVTIYSGGNDLVTLDVGSTTINSLTLGGVYKGYTSELTDGGTKQVLSITNALNIGQTGDFDISLYLYGGSTVTAGADSSNAGTIDLDNASTLKVTGSLDNSGKIFTGAFYAGGNTLTVTGTLTNESGAWFQVIEAGDVSNIGSLVNNGVVTVGRGATLNLTEQPGGITDIVAGSEFTIDLAGTFLAGANNAFYQLGSVEGYLVLENGQVTSVTPGGGVLSISNGGFVDLYNSTTLQINGDVSNSGDLFTGDGGNALAITGTLTNQGNGQFIVGGPGDVATLGGLVNSGFAMAQFGATIQINGDATNTGTLATNYWGGVGGGNTLNITGMLTNEAGGTFVLNGPGDMATLGSLTNNAGAFVDVESGSTLNIAGNVNNSAGTYIYGIVTGFNNTGGNTVNIGGTLTNSGWFLLLGNGDMATIGNGVVNSGLLDAEGGSTLQINGNVDNTGIVSTNWLAVRGGGDTLNITGTLTNEVEGRLLVYGPASISTVASLGNSGEVDVYGSVLQIGNVTNSGVFFVSSGSMATMVGLANSGSGFVDLEDGSTLQVNGDASNVGNFFTGYYHGGFSGGNMVTIGGTLTNGGTFQLNGPGDMATLGSLNNSGYVDVENGSTLQINGDATNSGTLYAGYNGHGGNTLNITGQLTNNGTFELSGSFLSANTAMIGSVVNNGFIATYGTSVLTVSGDMDNFGLIGGFPAFSGTVDVAGTLTNEFTGLVLLDGAVVTAGNVVNYGLIDFEEQGTLTVSGNVDNSGMIINGYYLHRYGFTLNIAGTLTNEGLVELDNTNGGTATIGSLVNSGSFDLGGQNTAMIGSVVNSGNFSIYDSAMATLGSLNNSGFVDLEKGSTLTINGNAINSGILYIAVNDGSALTINGNLDSSGGFDLENASALTVKGDVNNSGVMYTGAYGGSGGNTITINGNLTNGGTFQLSGPGDKATIGGDFTNSGIAILTNGSTLQINGDVTNYGVIGTGNYGPGGGGDTLNITGTMTNQGSGFGSGEFVLAGPGDVGTLGGLISSGLADVEISATLKINGDVTNSGTLATGYFGNGGGNRITIKGLLTNEATGQINLNGPGDLLQALAGLSNSGMINVNHGSSIDPPFVNNGGTINIDSLSKFVVGTGNPSSLGYIQLANGTLGEMISGLHSFGVINVAGSALLDGTLAILLQGGYNPAVGSTYKFMNFTPGMLNGTFASILNDIFNGGTEKWFVDYENGSGYVELIAEPNTPVPEPATLLVLIPGLLGVGSGLRRRLLN